MTPILNGREVWQRSALKSLVQRQLTGPQTSTAVTKTDFNFSFAPFRWISPSINSNPSTSSDGSTAIPRFQTARSVATAERSKGRWHGRRSKATQSAHHRGTNRRAPVIPTTTTKRIEWIAEFVGPKHHRKGCTDLRGLSLPNMRRTKGGVETTIP